MLKFLERRWFLMALVAVLAVGFAWPAPLTDAAEGVPKAWVVAVVLFLTALPLEAGAMWRALGRPSAVMLAVGVNYGLLPLVAWGTSRALRVDLAAGLMIAAAAPCTIASAAVWTRRAGGNDAVALLVTMITNLTCFVVTPFWLLTTTGQQVDIDGLSMAAELGYQVVVPTFAAQFVRLHRPIGAWATAHKVPLAVAAQCGILTMVWVAAVNSGQKLASREATLALFDWGAVIAAVLSVHLAMLAFGYQAGRLFSIRRRDRIAVAFSGSQKTLMIGIYVALEYFDAYPLAMLPMVSYHVGQLIVDTVIADRLRRRGSPPPGQHVAPSQNAAGGDPSKDLG